MHQSQHPNSLSIDLIHQQITFMRDQFAGAWYLPSLGCSPSLTAAASLKKHPRERPLLDYRLQCCPKCLQDLAQPPASSGRSRPTANETWSIGAWSCWPSHHYPVQKTGRFPTMVRSRYSMFARRIAVPMGLALSWIGAAWSDPGTPPHSGWTPTASLIVEVESQIRMPPRTALNSYRRYYYGIIQNDHRILIGIFLRRGFLRRDEQPGVEITSEPKAPAISDGGCGVVNLEYDVDQKQTLTIFCNGVA